MPRHIARSESRPDQAAGCVKSFTRHCKKYQRTASSEHFVGRWAWNETGAGKQFRPTAAISEDRAGLGGAGSVGFLHPIEGSMQPVLYLDPVL